MRLVLLNDTDGRENIGCRLTSSQLKRVLVKQAGSHGIRLDIQSCPWLFRRVPKAYLPRLSFALLSGQSLVDRRVLRELAAAEYGEACVAKTEGADVIVYQPEGSISDDHDSLRILRQLSLPLYAALYCSGKFGIANGTFPLFEDERRALIEGLVMASRVTYLRDELSARYYGCEFAPDAAIMWNGSAPQEGREFLLITTAAHAPLDQDLSMCASALELCQRHGLRPLVLTKNWQRLSGFRAQVESMGGVFREYATLDEADALLSRVRLHVGGRYHMALFCLTLGVPSWLVVTNTHKNRWLAEAFTGISLLERRGAEMIQEIDPGAVVRPVRILEDVTRYREMCSSQLGKMLLALSSSDPARARRGGPAIRESWSAPGVTAQVRTSYARHVAKSAIRKIGIRFRAAQ